jgi:NAD(P)-dependent dehydrogenase (short-subunit alcohol dehydrogenase family)
MRLKNKIAIITGGGTGIGLSCAQLFCREGAKSVIFGRRQDRLDQAVAEIGDQALAVSGDVTSDEDIQRLVETTVKTHGKIDILVNNAGVFTGAPVHEMESSEWDNILNINLTGVFKLTKAVLPQMIRQKSGSIIHISSILGLVATPNVAAYNTSKGALNQFSRSLAVEYGSSGIRSNAVCPGLIATEMTKDLMHDKELMKEWSKNYPIGRFGQPEDIAQACLFLAGDESSFVTGAVLPVDGGYTAL